MIGAGRVRRLLLRAYAGSRPRDDADGAGPAHARRMTQIPTASALPARPVLRIGDAERLQTSVVLQDAAAAGRLTLDELDERLAVAAGARTAPELGALVADLPAPPRRVDRPARLRRTAPLLLALLLVSVLTTVAWVATGVPVGWPLLVVLLVVWRRSRRVSPGG